MIGPLINTVTTWITKPSTWVTIATNTEVQKMAKGMWKSFTARASREDIQPIFFPYVTKKKIDIGPVGRITCDEYEKPEKNTR